MKQLTLGIVAAAALFAGEASAQGYCREYSQSVSIGGQRQSSYGTACMQPDGSWQVISNDSNYTNYQSGYVYAPPPQPVYVPTPVPVPVYRPTSSFSISIGGPSRNWDRDRWRYNDHYKWDRGHGNPHGKHGHGHW